MPITLTEVASNTATTSFSFGGDTVNVVYYPTRITEGFISILQKAQTMTMESVDTFFKDFNDSLAGVIKSWDVYATPQDVENQSPFPIDAQRFSELPIALRMKAYASISNALNPEEIAPQEMISNS